MATILGGVAVGAFIAGAIGSYVLFKESDQDIKVQSENEGMINNAVQITEQNNSLNTEIIWMVRVIIIILVLQFIYIVYKDHKRSLKKKYLARFTVNQQN